jgi:hypothetical protein
VNKSYLAVLMTSGLLFLCRPAQAQVSHYIDFVNGSDSNNGTSTSSPWKRHPYMRGWTGSYTHHIADRFIFKGGVTWPSSVLPLIPTNGGSSGSNDYYGVDQTWFDSGACGASFCRPIFDGGSTDISGQGGNGSLVYMNGIGGFITLDYLEIRNLFAPVAWGPALVYMYNTSNVTIQNCNLHGWQLKGGISTDDAHGAVWAYGSSASTIIDHNTISDVEHPDNGDGIYSVDGTISNNSIHDMSAAMLTVSGTISGNTIYNINYPVSDFDPNYHTNVIYLIGAGGTSYIRENLIYNMAAGTNIYPEPCWGGNGGAIYIFNNVVEDRGTTGVPLLYIDPENGSGACGSAYIWNNTLVSNNVTLVGVVNRSSNLNNLTTQNNHFITSNQQACYQCNLASHLTSSNNVTSSSQAAASQGYVLANDYAPTSNSVDTIHAGTNAPSNVFSADKMGVVRPSTGWDAGAYQSTGGVGPTGPTPPTNLTVTIN